MGFLSKKQRKAVMAKLKKMDYPEGRRDKVIRKMEKQERGVTLKPYDSQHNVHSWGEGNYRRHLRTDREMKALKPGKRITPNGHVYYEKRRNRSDKKPSKGL